MLHRDEAITEASESVYFYGGRADERSGEGPKELRWRKVFPAIKAASEAGRRALV